MKIYLDGKRSPFRKQPVERGRACVREETLGKKGMLIRSIEVDGASWTRKPPRLTGGTEARFGSRPVRDFLSKRWPTLRNTSSVSPQPWPSCGPSRADRTPEGLNSSGKRRRDRVGPSDIPQQPDSSRGDDSEVGGGGLGEVKSALLAELEKASRSVEEGKPLELASLSGREFSPASKASRIHQRPENIGDSTVQ